MDFIQNNATKNEDKIIENKDELIDEMSDKKPMFDIESTNISNNDDLMMYDGNGIDDVSSATVSPSDEVKEYNTNNAMVADDFGPETDVDAVDEIATNHITKVNEENADDVEKIEIDVPDKVEMENPFLDDNSSPFLNNSNPFGSLENKIIEGLTLNNPDLKPGNNPFDLMDDAECSEHEPKHDLSDMSGIVDNKLIDEFESTLKNENLEKHQERIIDFSEKKDFSFEREEFEKELTLDGQNMDEPQQQQQQEPQQFDNLQFESARNINDDESTPKLFEAEPKSIAENKQGNKIIYIY